MVYLNYNINTKFQLGENQNTNLLFRTSHRSFSGLKEKKNYEKFLCSSMMYDITIDDMLKMAEG